MTANTTTTTAALVVLLLAATHNFVSVNSWSIIQPSSFITKQRSPFINSFRSTSLQLSSSDNNDNSNSNNNNNKKKKKPDLATQVSAMGLNELQTQFRLAIAREDMDAAILYRDELANRVDGNNNIAEEVFA
jgi:hypothetical protein